MQALQRALDTGYTQESVDAVLALYSDSYRHEDGETKADLLAFVQWYFQNYVVLQVQTVSEQYAVGADGSVTQTITRRIADRDRETGEQRSYDSVSVVLWTNEGGNWRITSARDGAMSGA